MLVAANQNWQISPKPWSIALANRVHTGASFSTPSGAVANRKFWASRGMGVFAPVEQHQPFTRGLGNCGGNCGCNDCRHKHQETSATGYNRRGQLVPIPVEHCTRMYGGSQGMGQLDWTSMFAGAGLSTGIMLFGMLGIGLFILFGTSGGRKAYGEQRVKSATRKYEKKVAKLKARYGVS